VGLTDRLHHRPNELSAVGSQDDDGRSGTAVHEGQKGSGERAGQQADVEATDPARRREQEAYQRMNVIGLEMGCGRRPLQGQDDTPIRERSGQRAPPCWISSWL